jgi:two-component system invasion response regulator UvrY
MLEAIRMVMKGQYYISGDVAQKLTLANFRNRGESSPLGTLSAREMQVMMMITRGQSTQDISDSLFLSPKTVSTYRHRLFEILDVSNDVELTHLAIRHGLLDNTQ